DLAFGGQSPPPSPWPLGWREDFISIGLFLESPPPAREADISGLEVLHLPAERASVGRNVSGRVRFFVDSAGPKVLTRPRPFTPPMRRAVISLRRQALTSRAARVALGMPEDEIVYEKTSTEKSNPPPGGSLAPDFRFELVFDPDDRGQLIIEAWLSDP